MMTENSAWRNEPNYRLCYLAGYAIMLGMAPDAEALAVVGAQAEKVKSALAPQDAGAYLNFTEQRVDLSEAFSAETLSRLGRVRSEFDPDGLFRANHEIVPA